MTWVLILWIRLAGQNIVLDKVYDFASDEYCRTAGIAVMTTLNANFPAERTGFVCVRAE